jgi:hypothetical protein
MIRNERIKLLATALNNLGIGAIITGIIAPFVHNELGSGWSVAGWFAGGALCIGAAQLLLGRLRP